MIKGAWLTGGVADGVAVEREDEEQVDEMEEED